MARIHASAVVERGAHLDDDVVVGANCFVNSGAVIGAGTVLEAGAVIEKDVTVGRNNHFFHHAVIGSPPQVLALGEKGGAGRLVIGDANVFHEHVTVHPSMYPDRQTVIGNRNFIMIGAHIGHDCVLEDQVVLSNFVQISGHCKIETGAWLSGVVVSHQFVTVGKWSYASGLAGLNKDVPPYMIVSGHYPPEIRGVNKRGMARAGLSEQQQELIYEAYKRLYRRKGSLVATAKAMCAEPDLDPHVREITEAIVRSAEHRYGRYLEQFRH